MGVFIAGIAAVNLRIGRQVKSRRQGYATGPEQAVTEQQKVPKKMNSHRPAFEKIDPDIDPLASRQK